MPLTVVPCTTSEMIVERNTTLNNSPACSTSAIIG